MKKLISIIFTSILSFASYGQTNTFPLTGNVGVGTDNPSSILQIEKSSDTYDNMFSLIHKSSSGIVHSNWNFFHHTSGNLVIKGSKGNWIFERESDTYDNMLSFVHKSSTGSIHSIWDFQQHTNGNLVLYNSNKKSVFLNSEGGLGIGTTTLGTHKLAVEGSIGSREVIVEVTGWSDFVFKNNYQLRTLEEVEQHISEKGHLPEIPSEAEVTENGINLGDMDAKLLQKIEELTLYLIEQNKQNQAQQAKIEQLEKKIAQFENK